MTHCDGARWKATSWGKDGVSRHHWGPAESTVEWFRVDVQLTNADGDSTGT